MHNEMGAPASGIMAEAVLTPRYEISDPDHGRVLFRRNRYVLKNFAQVKKIDRIRRAGSRRQKPPALLSISLVQPVFERFPDLGGMAEE
ncbi:MAG: hypothetical protein JWM32_2745 [Verrucomicrobia bacterium]|nr:hypothetical protein [Verrucomicrobiota bacterium]